MASRTITDAEIKHTEATARRSSEIETMHVSDTEQQTTSSRLPFLSRLKFKIDDQIIYDAILGTTDGLTVPFALTAGLASVGSTKIVILGGLAELVAGAISMGLGGFVGAKSECETYAMTERKCDTLLSQNTPEVRDIVDNHFSTYNLPEEERSKLVASLLHSQTELKDFLMRHHFESTQPDSGRPYLSAVVLGMSYFLAGFLALIPYLCVRRDQVYTALYWSIGIMAIVMLTFGYIKTCVVRGWHGKDNIKAGIKGGLEMLVIGALAVGAAVGLVRAIEHGSDFK